MTDPNVDEILDYFENKEPPTGWNAILAKEVRELRALVGKGVKAVEDLNAELQQARKNEKAALMRASQLTEKVDQWKERAHYAEGVADLAIQQRARAERHTGDPLDGMEERVSAYLADTRPAIPAWLTDALRKHPLGTCYTIQHDGFHGHVIGYYQRHDGKRGVVMQFGATNIVHVYGDKWLQ